MKKFKKVENKNVIDVLDSASVVYSIVTALSAFVVAYNSVIDLFDNKK